MAQWTHWGGTLATRWTWLRVLALTTILAGTAACGKSPQEQVEDARAAMAEKDYATAAVALKNVLQEAPDNPEARVLLAQSSFALGDALAAEKELERAYELGIDASAHRALHYRIQIFLGHFEEVSVALTQEGGDDGLTAAEAATFKGQAELGLRRAEDAEASFRRALASDPDYGPAKVGLARVQLLQGRRDEAVRIVDEAVVSHPDLTTAWLLKGRLNILNGRLEAAGEDLVRAVEVAREAPDRPREYLALAALTEVRIELGDLDGAQQSLREMRAIAASAPTSLKLAARLNIAREQYPEARAQLQKVLAANGDDAAALFLLGVVYLAEGDPAQAEIHLARVVRLAPENLAARQMLARAQLQNARPDSAVEALAPLLESEGTLDPQTSFLASQAMLQSGATAEAVALLEKSHEADPGNMQIAMNLGSAYLAADRPDDAVALFESLPESDDYRRDLLLAVAYVARNEPEQAKAQIDEVLAKHPDDVAARLLVARYYFSVGELDASRGYLEEVLATDPDNIFAKEYLARIAFRQGDRAPGRQYLEDVLEQQPDNVAALLVLGEIATRDNRLEEAIPLLEHAVAVAPENAGAHVTLARAKLAAGDRQGAARAADRAAELAPGNGLVLLLQGDLSYEAGRYTEALGYLTEATELMPDLAAGWQRRASAQLALEDRGGARASLNRALELQPDMLRAAAQLALLDSREGNTEAALDRVRRLREVYPTLASPEVLEGEIQVHAENYPAAAAAYERGYAKQPSADVALRAYQAHVLAGEPDPELLEAWLAEHPDDQRTRLSLALHHERVGNTSTAIREYERLLEENPDDVVTQNNMAYLLNREGDPRAEEFARRAHELRPDLPAVQDTLGWVLVSNGKVEEGIEFLEAAFAAAPEEGDIAYHLAVALNKSGDSARSAELLRTALAADRPFDMRADAERLLAEIGGR